VAEIFFAYLAGLLTLINPCVLPVLPFVLGAALNANRFGPVALAAGMGISFVALGLFVALVGRSIGLTEQVLGQTGAALMILFGLILLVPPLSRRFERLTAGFAAQADGRFERVNGSGLWGMALGGALLGAVWSPCVGPTLGGAIALASQGESLARAALIMTGFALGIGTVMVGLGYGARGLVLSRNSRLRRIATAAKPIMGVIFLLVGLSLIFGVNLTVEGWLLDHMPLWLQDLSIAF